MDRDAALVRAARRGSAEALGRLFDRHWPAVWRAAYGVAHDRELADDAAQDAFLRAAASLDSFDERRPLAPWLVRIAVNRAIDLVRARGRLVRLDAGACDGRVEGPDADRDLLAAVARLAPERRAVVALHYWLDYTTPEIADVLGVPVGTVASRLSRALGELRAELEARHV